MEPYSKYDTIDDKKICYSLWDISGNERFEPMRSLFYRGSMATIIFFNINKRSTFDCIPNLLDEVSVESPDQILIMVGISEKINSKRHVSKHEAVVMAKELNCLRYMEFNKFYEPKKFEEVLSIIGIFLINIRDKQIGGEIYDTVDFLYFALNKPEWVYLDKTVFSLNRNELLEKIITEIDDLWVQYTAAEKLSDTGIQNKLLGTNYTSSINDAVSWGKKNNRSKLGLPVHISPIVAKIVVEQIDNQNILENLLYELDNENIKIELVNKIANQEIINQIALYDPVDSLRLVAVGRLAIQSTLEKIAINDKCPKVRKNAINKVVNQKTIEKVVITDIDEKVRREAVQKLQNQKHLAELALNDHDRGIRQIAVYKIKNQKIIEKIALIDNSPRVRLEATKKLTNEKIIKKVALEDSNDKVKLEAIEKINNQSTLLEISLSNASYELTIAAFFKIKDIEMIGKIAIETKFSEICLLAIQRITNIRTLLILRLKKDPHIQPFISKRIKELSVEPTT